MTGSPSPDPSVRFLESLRSDHRTVVRRTKASIILLAVLNLFVICYMSWIYSAVSNLDAGQLTLIASDKLESSLPDMQKDLTDYVVSVAPEVTDRGREVLLRAPAAIRENMESVIAERMRKEIANLEDVLDTRAQAALDENIARLRDEYPSGDDELRLEAFLDNSISEYRIRMEAMVDTMYGEFTREIRRLDAHFARLQAAEDLTEQEAIQREILEAWVVLVEKHEITSGE